MGKPGLLILKSLLAVAGLMLSASVLAGNGATAGNVYYQPYIMQNDATPVPMLGGFGLLVLAGLISAVSLRLFKRQGGGHWVLVAGLGSALVVGGSGVKLVSDAYAGILVNPRFLSDNSGGVVELSNASMGQNLYNIVLDTGNVPQQITQIFLEPNCSITEANAGGNGGVVVDNGGGLADYYGTCQVGTVLQADNDYCDLSICCGSVDTNAGSYCLER